MTHVAKSPGEPSLPASPLDRARALSLCGGDEEMARTLASLLLRTLPSDQAALDAAVSSGDGAAMAHLAHKMRSSLGSVGAIRASEAAAELEEQAEQGGPMAAQAAATLLLELGRAVDALRDAAGAAADG